MKTRLLKIITSSIFLCQTLHAQDSISKLTIPASPAFSILNYEPSAIMRPSNVKSLATDVLNSFDRNGKILVNLGLEVSPYWLGSHPKLKMADYLNPGVGQTVLQSFSVSAATVKDSASGDNKLGVGFRFKLYNGEPAKSLELAVGARELKLSSRIVGIIVGVKSGVISGGTDTKQKAIDAIERNLLAAKVDKTIIDDFKKEADKIKKDFPTEDLSTVQLFLDKLSEERVEAYKELQTKVSDLIYERKGFIIEFAGASGFNTSKSNSVEKIGFWGNASYFVSNDDLFSFTARYIWQNRDTLISNFDAGFGYLKKTNKFNVSVECMLRWYRADIPDVNGNNQPITRAEKKFTYRLAAQGSYLISKDISINLSFGKNFDSPFISRSGFFSILGLNYSIFSKEPSKLKN